MQVPLPVLQSSTGSGFFLLFFLFVVVMGLVWIGVSYWVYKDATRRNMDNAAVWAIATFVIGIFGLVLYLIVRD